MTDIPEPYYLVRLCGVRKEKSYTSKYSRQYFGTIVYTVFYFSPRTWWTICCYVVSNMCGWVGWGFDVAWGGDFGLCGVDGIN